MSDKKNKITAWLGKKFHLILYHSKSYGIVKKYKFNRLGFLFTGFSIFLLFFIIIAVIIVFTPLKELIPGYPDRETKMLIYDNAIRTDSLLIELEIRNQYLDFLRDAIFNDVPIDEDFVLPITGLTREQVDRFNDPRTFRLEKPIQTQFIVSKKNETLPKFFIPIKGIVTSEFNPVIKHFGTDIATAHEDIIKSVMNGTVVISNFTVETGYTIVIQHQNNILSVYRHVKSVLVDVGDDVNTGQAIAVYGGTGELTSGKHLHFELWKDGKPINPELYIDFL